MRQKLGLSKIAWRETKAKLRRLAEQQQQVEEEDSPSLTIRPTLPRSNWTGAFLFRRTIRLGSGKSCSPAQCGIEGDRLPVKSTRSSSGAE